MEFKEKKAAIEFFESRFKPSKLPLVLLLIFLAIFAFLFLVSLISKNLKGEILLGVCTVVFGIVAYLSIQGFNKRLKEYKKELKLFIERVELMTEEDCNNVFSMDEASEIQKIFIKERIVLIVCLIVMLISLISCILRMFGI